jgi:hypothetical protein
MTGKAKRAQYTLEIQTGSSSTGEERSKPGGGVGDAGRGAADPSQLGQGAQGRETGWGWDEADQCRTDGTGPIAR